MAQSYQPETFPPATLRQQEKVATLLEALSRMASSFAYEIEQAEERSGIRDQSDPCYPVVARNLR